MALKDFFANDENIIFNTSEFAKSITYTPHGGSSFETSAIQESFLSLESSNEKETCVFILKKSDFSEINHPAYRDKISLSGVIWTVERIANDGEVSIKVIARRAERGKY